MPREHKYADIYRAAAELIESGYRCGMRDAIATTIRHRRHASSSIPATGRLISLAVGAMRDAYAPVGGGDFEYWGEIGAFGPAAATCEERLTLSRKRRIAALHALADGRKADIALLRQSFEETYRSDAL